MSIGALCAALFLVTAAFSDKTSQSGTRPTSNKSGACASLFRVPVESLAQSTGWVAAEEGLVTVAEEGRLVAATVEASVLEFAVESAGVVPTVDPGEAKPADEVGIDRETRELPS